MISLLVSSKTMAPKADPFELSATTPQFLKQAEKLNEILMKKSSSNLQKLMHVSPKLANEVQTKIGSWQPKGGTPAWYTFVGDVYKGLKIREFTKEDVAFAQKHMATISGLYGLLRPLDAIHPYRLELMYKLSGPGFKNLYEFWGDSIANIVPKDEPIINLASEEYMKALRPHLPKTQIITPWFYQTKNGKPDFQTVHAKMARGAMARWIAKNRIHTPTRLKEFNLNGYHYAAALCEPLKPAFIRPEGYDFRSDY